MRITTTLLVLLTAGASPALAAPPPGQHPFSVHDMVAMERLSDPQPSPDGTWILFTRRSWDEKANKVYNNLWLVSIDGKTLRQLTSAKASDTGGRWSPDGGTIAGSTGGNLSTWQWTFRRQ